MCWCSTDHHGIHPGGTCQHGLHTGLMPLAHVQSNTRALTDGFAVWAIKQPLQSSSTDNEFAAATGLGCRTPFKEYIIQGTVPVQH